MTPDTTRACIASGMAIVQAFGPHLERHDNIGNLHLLGAMVSPGLHHERGL